MRLLCVALWVAGCGPKQLRVADDPELAAFLTDVLAAVERHDWDRLHDACDPAHVATQQGEFGQPRDVYLAEILGLHFVDNSIDDEGDGVDQADLDRVHHLEPSGLVRPDRTGAKVPVRGKAVLVDGPPLTFELWVLPTPGGPRLAGGVG